MKGFNPTKAQLQEWVKKGMLDPSALKPGKSKGGRRSAEEKGTKEKQWMETTLLNFCESNDIKLEIEYRFLKARAWRFDFAIRYKRQKIAFEYEGIFSEKSRHTTKKGYTGDAEKYSAAAALGWKVFRYTAMNYENLASDLKLL